MSEEKSLLKRIEALEQKMEQLESGLSLSSQNPDSEEGDRPERPDDDDKG